MSPCSQILEVNMVSTILLPTGMMATKTKPGYAVNLLQRNIPYTDVFTTNLMQVLSFIQNINVNRGIMKLVPLPHSLFLVVHLEFANGST